MELLAWFGGRQSVGQPGFSSIGLSTAPAGIDSPDDSTISAQAIGTPADSSGGCHADVAKAVLDTQAANEVFRSGAASEALDRIQKPSNRKPSTAPLRTDSARSLRSSTWWTRRKFR